MASSDSLYTFLPAHNEPPSANYATWNRRNRHPVLEFDPATDEAAVFSAVMPQNYSGGGLTVYLHTATVATSGDLVMTAAFERVGDEVQDIDSDGFAAAKSVTFTVPAVSGHVSIDSIAFTNGAEMDSIAVGELFRLKITRDADNINDTVNSNDAQLLCIELRET